MAHPLIEQLRFARSEFWRGLEGISDDDAERRLRPMNSIAWMVGHLAWQERLYWLRRAQGLDGPPELDVVASGAPATTPAMADMRRLWTEVVTIGDPYLDSLAPPDLDRHVDGDEGHPTRAQGTLLLRMIYHYWSHTGEASAVRQMLGHQDLPEFVGDIEDLAPYRKI
jgi:hypothetical protein